MVVYTSHESNFERAAREIADHREEKLVHDAGGVPSDEPVVYVEDMSEIDETTLVRFQRHQLRDSYTPFSVVTGYTPDDALALYHRDLPDEGIHSLVMLGQHDYESSDPDCEILSGGDVTAENLRRQDERGLASFNISTHGWPIHLNLSRGLLCGFPEDVSVEEYPEPQPFCVQDGERQCPYDADLLPAREFHPSHAFLLSCGSVIDNGYSGLPVHVGAGLLSNVESLVGPYRMSGSYLIELFLHYALLKGGYNVSERVYLLNKNAHINDIRYCPYIPLGRPSAGLSGVDGEEATYSLRSADANRFELTDIDAPVIDVSLPIASSTGADDRNYVKLLNGVDEDIYYLLFEEGDERRLIVYSTGRLVYDELRFEISNSPPCAEEVTQANRMLDNAERHANLDILNDTATRQLETLREQTRRFPEAVHAHNYNAQTYTKTEKRAGELLGNATAIHDELLSDIQDESKYLSHKYARRAIDHDIGRSDRTCARCERVLFLKHASDGRGTRRTMGTCPKCGMVFDVPAANGEWEGRPIVTGETIVTGGETTTITIRFTNPKDHPTRTTVCPVIRRRGNKTDDGRSIFEPEHQDLTVEGGETVDVEFDFRTAIVRDNQYIVLGYVISNLELYMGCATIIVGDETGFYEPRHDA